MPETQPTTALAIIPPAAIIPVTARPHPFSMETVYAEFPAGQSLAEILGPHARACRMEVAGIEIPPEWYAHIRPKAGVPVVIVRFPEGGASAKSIFRIIAFAALAVGVAFITAGTGSVLMTAIGDVIGISTAAVCGLAGAAVGLVGSLVINALIPPQNAATVGGGGASTDLLRSITGTSNKVNQYGAIPCAVGVVLVYPTLAALPVTELSGDDQYLRMLFDLGYGTPAVSDMKIGTNDLATYTHVETQIAVNPGLFSQDIGEATVTVELDTDGNNVTRTTSTAADEGSLDLQFASGLFGVDANGYTITVTCKVRVEFAPTGTSSWSPVTSAAGLTVTNYAANANSDGTFHVINGERKAVRIGIRWKFPTNGTYDIRITRVSTDWGGAASNSRIGALTWTVLRTIRYTGVSTTGTLKLALRIKATDQLNGSISQFNCILAQPIPVYHPSTDTWVTEVSSNNAWVYRWLLKDCPANPRKVDASRIDDDALKAWAIECDAKGFSYSNNLDQTTTVFAVLKDICAAGRAAFNIREGRYGVVRDIAQTTPIQVFTPRNSWGFAGSRAFPDQVHALRVQFINPEAVWVQDEILVYDDGYGDATLVAANPVLTLATKFEQITLNGCTDANAAWRLGRYHLACGRLRPNTYTWSADIENLVCNRGDMVLVANDVIAVGIAWGRITATSVNGSGLVTGFTCDEELTCTATSGYSVRIRCQDGSVVLTGVTLPRVGSGIKALTLSTPAFGILTGDLFVFGKTGQDTIPMIVTKIEPGVDLSAKITAIDAAPGVLTADAGTPPTFVSQITGQPWQEAPLPPDLLIINSDQTLTLANDAGNTSARMSVTVGGHWSLPIRGVAGIPSAAAHPYIDHIEVRYRLASTVGAWTTFVLPKNTCTIDIQQVVRGAVYQVEARTVAVTGAASVWIQQTHTVANTAALPIAPISLSALSVADGIALGWVVGAIQRADVEYEVQRTGDISGSPDASSWLHVTNVKALTYTDGVTDRVLRWYRVRAVDFQGLASAWVGPVNQHNKAVDDGAAVSFVTSGITYTCDDTTITPSWAVDGYLTDKPNSHFGGSGSLTLTGLSPSTSYKTYPYWDQPSNAMAAVLTGGTGSPAWCHVGSSRAWTAEQCKQGHLPLSNAPIVMATIATPPVGSPPAYGGGYGGGDGGCLRNDMLVLERRRGVILASTVRQGDQLRARAERWLRVLNDPQTAVKLHDMWVLLDTSNGVKGLIVTAGHGFECAETSEPIRAHDLNLQSSLRCPTGVCHPTSISLLAEHGWKVPIQLEAPHTFFASTDGNVWVETHNAPILTA